MTRPGAFRGTALTMHGARRHDEEQWTTTESLWPLPTAVLVHETHRWSEGDLDAAPVGVAVPTLDAGRLVLHAVLASTAHAAWNKLCHRIVDRLSIVATGDPADWTLRRDGGVQITSWTLVAVDLVRMGADPDAHVEAAWSELTPAEAEVQRRLDAALARPAGLWGIDLYERAREVGVAALNDALGHLVEPLLPQLAGAAA